MTEEEKKAEIERLKAKVNARKGIPGYKQNVADLEKRIAELEA